MARQEVREGAQSLFPKVSVVSLRLSDFRCYESQHMEVGSGPVILTGQNGSGKTNVLEALSFVVPGRGLRAVKLADISRRDPNCNDASNRLWAVAAKLNTKDGSVRIGTGREIQVGSKRDKRVIQLDGKIIRSQSILGKTLNVQWLTPQMDRLFLDGPSARRRFLDRLVFGVDPFHAGRVSAYEHAMRERSKLLRNSQFGNKADPKWISALEETMASKGVAVIAARMELATRIDQIACEAAKDGIFPSISLCVTGIVEQWLNSYPALEVEDRIVNFLAKSRQDDRENGFAEIGPHRSDIVVYHLGSGQKVQSCSTGEQKASLISLILANARLGAKEQGVLPLLLLDDVTAHLDVVRREALFDEILKLGIQAWITGTDANMFKSIIGKAQFFNVEDSKIVSA